jgi:CheY-like chemotaxis protein
MPKVLIVDDAPLFRDYLATLLSRHGLTVELVEDAREALKRLEQGSYDVVVTDVMMPQMDGVEFVREVRARLPHLPIVVATGAAGPMRGPLARILGHFGVTTTLDKSIPPRQFAEVVLQACRSKQTSECQ